MGQAKQRGTYEERKAQGIERKEAERIEREKLEAICHEERMAQARERRLLHQNSGTGGRKGKARYSPAMAAFVYGAMARVGQI